MGWAGVYWQNPVNNWGTKPGLRITGATAIRFYAWGAIGGERVSFVAGFMGADGFSAENKDVLLSTTPTQLTVDSTGKNITRVAGGFGWIAGNSMRPVRFFIDDIQWR